jgi:hypothetical protein
MIECKRTLLAALTVAVVGLGGCDTLGLVDEKSPTIAPASSSGNPETVAGGGQALALEQKVIVVRAPGIASQIPPATATVTPLIGVDAETPGLKVDQLIWACEGSYPASVNPEIGKYGCSSYVAGFIDSVVLVQYLAGKNLICVPDEGIQKDRAVQAFLRWGRDHPESHNENARSALMVVFAEEYPCTS